jgi:hypothetical protein
MGDSITGTTDASGKPKSTRVVSAASTNATLVKPSAGALFGWLFYNTAAYDVFVKFYDKATAPVVGTDVPVLTVKVKAGDKDEYISVFGRTFVTASPTPSPSSWLTPTRLRRWLTTSLVKSRPSKEALS